MNSEWKVWTKAIVGEDDIDYDDAASVDLTIECDDGINPAITGTFTVSIEDVVSYVMLLNKEILNKSNKTDVSRAKRNFVL